MDLEGDPCAPERTPGTRDPVGVVVGDHQRRALVLLDADDHPDVARHVFPHRHEDEGLVMQPRAHAAHEAGQVGLGTRGHAVQCPGPCDLRGGCSKRWTGIRPSAGHGAHRAAQAAGRARDRDRRRRERRNLEEEKTTVSSDQLKVSRTVDASPEQLFALLSKPSNHEEIDGASMLRGIEGSDAPVSGVGDEFIMKMSNDALGDYRMHNEIVAFEPDRKIGWAPSLHPIDGYTDKLGDVRAVGHTYTWELEPEGGGTKVTQIYDWSGVKDENFRGFFPMLSEEQLADSIDKAGRAAK
jgi:uncharacterized protein YndB with AHSA1/START domain